MEYKDFQNEVIEDLQNYILWYTRGHDTGHSLDQIWTWYWHSRHYDVADGDAGAIPTYKDTVKGVPYVSFKIPTGGGKTFIAAGSLRKIFDAEEPGLPRLVIWLAPTTAIMEQTKRNLEDVNHPYRMKIDRDFAGRVQILGIDELLSGTGFTPDEVKSKLTIAVLSYQALRIKVKDQRLAYRDNGQLLPFADSWKGYESEQPPLLDGSADSSLVTAIRACRPVIIADESHHTTSSLSTKMLAELNPRFILGLTATPRRDSNIISYVNPQRLKDNGLIKLPLVVYNRSRDSVLMDTIMLRNHLEQQAGQYQEGRADRYIRPIALLQAESKGNDERTTHEKLRKDLIDAGVSPEQIAVKTADVDTLKGHDLTSPDCPIRFVITVSALQEGWDCPFVYILSTIASRSSPVDVEQIVGRVLRQPHAQKTGVPLLDLSYVITSSSDFQTTLDNVVQGIVHAGITEDSYRSDDDSETADSLAAEQVQGFDDNRVAETDGAGAGSAGAVTSGGDLFAGLEPVKFPNEMTEEEKQLAESGGASGASDTDLNINLMISQALAAAAKAEGSGEDTVGSISGGESSATTGGSAGTNRSGHSTGPNLDTGESQIREAFADATELRFPVYYKAKAVESLSDEALSTGFYPGTLLYRENLDEKFTLADEDAKIDLSMTNDDVIKLDWKDRAVRRVSLTPEEYHSRHAYLSSLSKDKLQNYYSEAISNCLDDKFNGVGSNDIRVYVDRALGSLSEDAWLNMEDDYLKYADAVRRKIQQLQSAYRKKQFEEGLRIGKYILRPTWKLPLSIHPARGERLSGWDKCLYVYEYNHLTSIEREVVRQLSAAPNVVWWHRNPESNTREGFFINAFVKHAPDFIARLANGKILIIEAKGVGGMGLDSAYDALQLGTAWSGYAGSMNMQYLMVVEDALEPKFSGRGNRWCTLRQFKKELPEM